MQIGRRARRVEVMRRRAAEARVQDPDIERALARRPEFRQQGFGRMALGEADALHSDVEPAAGEHHGLAAPAEHGHDSGSVSSRVMRDSAS